PDRVGEKKLTFADTVWVKRLDGGVRDSFSIRIVEWRALQERYTPFQIAPRRQTFRKPIPFRFILVCWGDELWNSVTEKFSKKLSGWKGLHATEAKLFMIESQRHSYHLVDPSPWPISGSLGALATTVGGVMYMHSFQRGATLLSLGLIFILYTMFVWWHDVLRESTLEGHHTKVIQLGPRYGFILFIVSEVMFLFALFRASSHSSLAPTVDIGGIWPPKGIAVLDPQEIPFLNTLIPFSSGAVVTWAHHAILTGKEKRAVYALVATVSLALVFTAF
nr:cytochrome c oxidase subunit 3, mitochondrial [Tanacetum cinerariifolium]